jgi:hypothetical protein
MVGSYIFLGLLGTIWQVLGTNGMCLAQPVFNAETGELTMSDITADWIPLDTQTVTESEGASSMKTRKPYWRAGEFRAVLDHYMGVFARTSSLIG